VNSPQGRFTGVNASNLADHGSNAAEAVGHAQKITTGKAGRLWDLIVPHGWLP
jgi:hypothetical protein